MTNFKTIEIDVGTQNSMLHQIVRGRIMSNISVFQMSSGGEPYKVRLVVSESTVGQAEKVVKGTGAAYTVLEGAQGL